MSVLNSKELWIEQLQSITEPEKLWIYKRLEVTNVTIF